MCWWRLDHRGGWDGAQGNTERGVVSAPDISALGAAVAKECGCDLLERRGGLGLVDVGVDRKRLVHVWR